MLIKIAIVVRIQLCVSVSRLTGLGEYHLYIAKTNIIDLFFLFAFDFD